MNSLIIQKYIPKFLLPLARRFYCHLQRYILIFASFRERSKCKAIKSKKNILIFHPTLLSFGGTEKNLQLIAKYLDKNKYNVYIMYGNNKGLYKKFDRLTFMKEGGLLTEIPFLFSSIKQTFPSIISDMTPTISSTINFYNIDCVITAGPGLCDYPMTDVKVPIILINIFGVPQILKNIRYNICVSETIKKCIEDIVPLRKIKIMYNPSEGPGLLNRNNGKEIREKYGIKDTDVVFGRIGRDNNDIFDFIGIKAFEKLVEKYHHIYYMIVSPCKILIDYVNDHKVKNIIFIDPLFSEDEVRKFHLAIDVLAHFRKDGETCGVNIIESMLCSNPIVSHKSHIWNAHLEYLDDSFSFVAEIDDVDQYRGYMEIFAKDTDKTILKKMGKIAKDKAYKLFHITSYMGSFDHVLQETLK